MNTARPSFRVAIACGGTGGHLFPGLAVGQELVARGCDVSLLVSPKDVDQQAVRCLADEFEIVTLPAIGLAGGNLPAFAAANVRSFLAARRAFRDAPPHAVLAMGGFTSAPPVLAGSRAGAVTFLHESNTIPGRANRWLAHVVDECFVGFPEAAGRLWNPRVTVSGTPVRPQFAAMDPAGLPALPNVFDSLGERDAFVAVAVGVVSPNVSSTAPGATDTDVWQIDFKRKLANTQDGVGKKGSGKAK